MKKLLYMLVFACQILAAQPQVIDSLARRIENYPTRTDTLYLDMRNDYVRQKILYDPTDSALLSYAQETLEISNEIDYPKGQVLALQRIGAVIHYLQGKPVEAIDYYQKALEILNGHPELIKYTPGSLINLANVYTGQGDHEKALRLFKRLHLEFEDNDVVAHRIGNVYVDMEQYDSAMHYFKLAIVEAERLKNHAALAYSHSALSFRLSSAGKPDEAVSHIEQSLSLLIEYDIAFLNKNIYSNAAMVYQKARDFDQAEIYSLKALEAVGPSNHFSRRNLYGTLYEVYKESSKFSEALDALEKYIESNDSLTNNDRKLETAKKEIEFEARQKELLAQAEISKHKLISKIYLASGGGVIFAISLISFLFWQRRAAITKANEAEFKTNLIESKLVALRAQLNPHFTFNALNAIDQYMMTHGVEKASDYLVKFASLMRNVLDNSQDDWIPVSEEIKMTSLYVEIAGLRLQDSIKLTVDIDPGINPETTLIPSWLIQPIIENSIEHGIMKIDYPGTISVRVFPDDFEKLTFIIEDNGVGMAGKKISENGRPSGMKMVKDRIRYLNELTDTKTYFEIRDIDNGVNVTITIPFKTI